jgi:hypothetical protein
MPSPTHQYLPQSQAFYGFFSETQRAIAKAKPLENAYWAGSAKERILQWR